ncbi:MAG: 1-deoxy-D-xylulose-5-phosphate reductoisomerase [Halocynthiibacter sp.]
MTKTLSIFGATGSIGQSTIDLVKRAPERFSVSCLTGGRNIEQLVKDAKALQPSTVIAAHDGDYTRLKEALSGTGIEVGAGRSALLEAAGRPCDMMVSGIIGAAGLEPGLEALKAGVTVALANKESLVCAGALLLKTAADHKADILPVDSEHSAIFQAMIGEDMDAVEEVTLTASGGALRDWPLEKLKTATVEEAATHPNWDMGQRITIDSASMFNKAMELIETKEFFGFNPAQIKTVIHPQSIIHAMVMFKDGALMSHLGAPDMRHAIGFALNYPHRCDLPVARIDLAEIGQLTFSAPDAARYPALGLAYEVMAAGGLSGAVFNAAKEAALDGFIARKIAFTDMADVVRATLNILASEAQLPAASMTLDAVNHIDALARRTASAYITQNH